ncbi:GntR family transcriptional regulator [Pseudaestuariivita rosea]|uniref:GntR family transcriptional regulator n=1 Tax=Pseudaestuariivita rosea TaxID=2763263 RepID=UPI001ABA73ED|nr:GntR family transcriptional regulator [Pseudaestuariivita rosea]
MSTLYQRILDDLTHRIATGALSPGEMLPSETDLGAEYGVSQGTARKALGLLEARGILERRQGRGTFVARSTDERALFHFFRLRATDGSTVIPQLERQTVRRRKATKAERALSPDHVYEIDRLRSIRGRMAARERIIVPAHRFAGLNQRDDLPNALYPYFQRVFGVTVLNASEDITPLTAPHDGYEDLEVAATSPLFSIRRQAWDVSENLCELRQCVYVAEGLCYSADLR